MSVYPVKIHSPSRPARALDGKIITSEHARFDEARRAWNLTVDQRPAAVVFPESAQDVAAAVLFARQHGLRVAAQGTGHNAGPLGSLQDTILLKTERMRGVHVDPKGRLARVEAGAVWLEVVEAAAGARTAQRHDPDCPDAGAQSPAHGPRAPRARSR